MFMHQLSTSWNWCQFPCRGNYEWTKALH